METIRARARAVDPHRRLAAAEATTGSFGWRRNREGLQERLSHDATLAAFNGTHCRGPNTLTHGKSNFFKGKILISNASPTQSQ